MDSEDFSTRKPVTANSGGKHSINYRAHASHTNDVGEVVWQVEYDGNGTWGPRGIITERDGTFQRADRYFQTAYDALNYAAIYLK